MRPLRVHPFAWEIRFCHASVNLTSQTWMKHYFVTVSRLGDGVIWYVMLALLPLFDPENGLKNLVHIAVTALIALQIYRVLKHWTKRPRPCAQGLFDPMTPALDEFSFPSGHTLHAVCFSLMFAHFYPALTGVLLFLTLSIALSRVVLGLHYPSDVVAGAAIGVGLAQLSLSLPI